MRKVLFISFLLSIANSYAQKICYEKKGEIYVSNVDGSGVKMIAKGTESDLSLDSKVIVFTATEKNGSRYIAYANVAGGAIKRFKKIPKTESYSPEFSSDKRIVFFKYWNGESWSRGKIDLKDTKFSKLSDGEYYKKHIAQPAEIAPLKEDAYYPHIPYDEPYNENKIYVKVYIPAEFTGGSKAWKKYLESNLKADTVANAGAPAGIYTVRVQFKIDKEGNISEVQALNNPGFGMAEEAVRVIQKSPRWKPAIQNGKTIIYQIVQGITFQITDNK